MNNPPLHDPALLGAFAVCGLAWVAGLVNQWLFQWYWRKNSPADARKADWLSTAGEFQSLVQQLKEDHRRGDGGVADRTFLARCDLHRRISRLCDFLALLGLLAMVARVIVHSWSGGTDRAYSSTEHLPVYGIGLAILIPLIVLRALHNRAFLRTFTDRHPERLAEAIDPRTDRTLNTSYILRRGYATIADPEFVHHCDRHRRVLCRYRLLLSTVSFPLVLWMMMRAWW